MTQRVRKAAAAVLLVAGLAAVGTTANAAPQGGGQWPQRPQAHGNPKLDPALDPAASGSTRPASAGATTDGNGNAVVEVTGADADAIAAAVQAQGGEVVVPSPASVVARVPQANLSPLADDDRVHFVRVPRQMTPDANVTSEGVTTSGANIWQNNGRDGTGVKVAIVDVGFDGYLNAIAANQLPALSPAQTKNFCGSGMTGFDGRGPNGTLPPIDHGTAVAEIVHQMAPNATLYLICVFTDAQMTNAAQYMAQQGVMLANASIGDDLGGRGDGTGAPGSPAAAVALGYQSGQLWSVSAGNDAESHYMFTAVDRDNDTALELLPGNTVSGVDPSETYTFTLAPDATARIGMKWDAWPTTNPSSLLLLCFYQDSVSNPSPGCFSSAAGQEPTVSARFDNATTTTHTYIMAVRRQGALSAAPRVDLYFQGSEQNLAAFEPVSSLSEPATSPFVMTVGAHCYANNALEPFSSQGPTIDGRTKPDLSGPDGVSSNVFHNTLGLCNNHPGFYGTSAASPHAAGAAALVKQAAPNATAEQIRDLLMQRAIDAGPIGFDNQFGKGRLNLGAVQFVKAALSGPSAVSPAPGRTDVFLVGDDNALWTRSVNASGKTPWVSLGQNFTSDPDVSSWGPGRLDAFERGSDGSLMHRWSGDGVTWGPWESLGGTLAPGSGPGAVSWAGNRIDVFVRGTDNALWHKWFDGQWSGWETLGGVLAGDPDVASWGAGRLDVFVQGSDNALWHRFFGGAWSGWESLGGVLKSGPGAVSWGFNRIDVAVRGSDNAVYLKSWNGSAWQNFFALGGVVTSAPDIGSPAVGRLELFARGTDSTIYRNSFSGAWSGWGSIGPP